MFNRRAGVGLILVLESRWLRIRALVSRYIMLVLTPYRSLLLVYLTFSLMGLLNVEQPPQPKDPRVDLPIAPQKPRDYHVQLRMNMILVSPVPIILLRLLVLQVSISKSFLYLTILTCKAIAPR
jgi:hypothetical protein